MIYQLPDRQAAASEAGKNSHPTPEQSALELLRPAFSPHCYSLLTQMTAPLKTPSIKLLKFADYATLIGLIQDGDESAYRQEVEQLAVWCSHNNWEVTSSQTLLTLDTTCLHFSLQAHYRYLCTRTSRHKNCFFPHAMPKQLTQELLPVFCN